jgi:catechol 2,3-dioxygenase-like lactoylglutathione lyase family enzyme
MAPDTVASSAVVLDHIGLIVPDLAAARSLFETLGFTTTPRADHTRTDAQGRIVSAGSSQHSLMFEQGYVELMQITDRHAGHPLSAAPEERFGLHVLAFGVADAAEWHARCRGEGMTIGQVMDWSRPVETPERQGLARFRFFDAPWRPQDPSYLCWVQHLTPELVRTPSLLRHPNGARALAGLGYAGSPQALSGWAQRLRQATGTAAVPGGLADDDGASGSPQRRIECPPCPIDLQVDAWRARVVPVAMTIAMTSPEVLLAGARSAQLSLEQRGVDAWRIDLQSAAGLWLEVRRA